MRIAFFLWMSGSISLRSFAASRQSTVFSLQLVLPRAERMCGSRPPVQWMKKSFRLRLIRVPQVTDVPSVLPKIKKHLIGWIIQTVPQAHFWDL